MLPGHVIATFTASSHSNKDYTWNFGDGQTGTGNPVTHNYMIAGKYEVTLEVYSPYIPYGTNGPVMQVICSDKKRQTIVIDSLTYFDNNICKIDLQLKQNGLTVTPYDQSAYNKMAWVGTQNYYFWDFGDGFTSTETFPTHTYSKSGKYQIGVTKVSTKHDPKLDSIKTFAACLLNAYGSTIIIPCNYRETCRETAIAEISVESPSIGACKADIQISTSDRIMKGYDAIITTADYRP